MELSERLAELKRQFIVDGIPERRVIVRKRYPVRGDLVTLSREGMRQMGHLRAGSGDGVFLNRVRGRDDLIRVQRNNIKISEVWHKSFWQFYEVR